MAFQPYTDPDYFYPSGRTVYSTQFFDATGLTEFAPDTLLFTYIEGDFAYPVKTPVPHVEMTLFDLDPATVTVTVWRTVGKRTMPVRGSVRVPAYGGVNVADWEAPFGVSLSYWATEYDVDGIPIANTSPTVTQLDVDEAWIHNPLDPLSAVAVRLGKGSASRIPRGQDADVFWADGTGLAVAVTGQRRGVKDTPIVFYSLTDTDTDRVNDLLGDPYASSSGPMILCIRPGRFENTRWPRPFYALVDLEEQPVSHPAGGQITRWEGTGTEVPPPSIALIAAVLTYEDIDATYPTYEEEDAAYGDYLAGDRDYRLTGAADTTPNPFPGTPSDLGVYGAGIYGS